MEEDKKAQKPERDEQTGVNLKPLEKSKDQLLMERAEQAEGFNFRKNDTTNVTSGIPIATSAPRNFVNSNPVANTEIKFAPVQKTKQELMLEEAEKKEQELAIAQKNSSWIGSRKTGDTATEQPKPFKANPWAVAASKGEAPTGVKFAPINQSDQEKKMTQNSRQEQEFIFVSKKDM